MERHELKAIRKATDEILSQLTPDSFDRSEAVNWGDLSCVEVQHYTNDRGESGVRAVIKEADPSAHRLSNLVAVELHKRGWSGVEVSTEW